MANNWQLTKLKYILNFSEEKSDDYENKKNLALTRKGIVEKDISSNKGQIAKDYEKYTFIKKDQICMNPLDLLSGWVDISSFEGLVSPAYYTLVPKKNFSVKFINYFLQSNYYRETFFTLGKGVASHDNYGRWVLTPDEFKNIFIYYPSHSEQQKIVSYLDNKTSLIKSLIKKIQSRIDLFKEKKNDIINTAVTKGLNSNVKMRESGIEWIGNMPSHWKLIRLKYLFSLEGGKDPKNIQNDEGEYPILGTGGEISKGSEFLYDKPTLLLGRKGTIDKPFLYNSPFWVSDVMYYTIMKKDISPKYLYYLFKIIPFEYYQYGSTQPSMSRLDYENMYFPIPPNNEREQVLNYIVNHCDEIDKIISNERKRIELLEEYFQTLVSSVVTGEVKVSDSNI